MCAAALSYLDVSPHLEIETEACKSGLRIFYVIPSRLVAVNLLICSSRDGVGCI